jgi:hypothetical protein
MVGPTAIYSPFFQTSTLSYRSSDPLFSDPSSSTGSGSHRLHSHIALVTIHTRRRGSIFLTSCPSTHAHVQNYQIDFICYLSSDSVHVGYLVLMCVGTWSSKPGASPSGI